MSFRPLWEVAGLRRSAPTAVLDSAPSPPSLELVEGAEELEAPLLGEEDLAEARAAGHELGLAEGFAQAQAQGRGEKKALEERIAELEALVEGLELHSQAQAQDSAAQAVAVCAALTRRVLGDTLIHQPQALEGLVLDSLTRFPGGGQVQVRVPEARVVALRTLLARHPVEVVGDPEMAGGCVLERAGCRIDASVDALLQGLDEALKA